MANLNEAKKHHFIYKTTNLLNDKFYIGMHSTSNLKDGYLGSGKRLRYSIRKHGKENFKTEILEWLNDRAELAERENALVHTELLKDPLCMNLVVGGLGGNGGFRSVEQQRNRSIAGGRAFANRLKTDPALLQRYRNMGSISMTQAHIDGKIKYDTFTGKYHTDETKNKMRKSKNIGETNSQYGTQWMTNGVENKKIKRENTDYYLNNNWQVGRILIGNIGKNQYSKIRVGI